VLEQLVVLAVVLVVPVALRVVLVVLAVVRQVPAAARQAVMDP
jgi:hypothetical protein